MNTCEEHDGAVVVYNVRNCPVCDLVTEVKDAKDESKRLANELKEKTDEVAELKAGQS